MNKILSKWSLLVVLCFCAGVVSVCNATGSITGTVSDTSSENISGASVMVFREGASVDQDQTDSTGTYLIGGLAPNTYEVHIYADGYELRIESDVVVLDNNTTVRNVANLASEGIISGKVTLSNGTTIVSGAFVSAQLESGSGPALSSVTDSIGNYSIKNVPAGTYNVETRHRDHLFTDIEEAIVSAGVTISNINFSATASGSITGTVSNGTSGIEDAMVYAFQSSNPDISSGAITDSSGNYSIEKLPVGTYTVRAIVPDNECDDNTDNSVIAGQTTSGVDLTTGTPLPTGKITGKLTKSDETTAFTDAIISVMNSSTSDIVGGDTTDANGDYKIVSLPTGTYKVTAYDDNGLVAEEDNVSVMNGSTTTLNLSSEDGAISGTVTDSSQDPIEDAILVITGSDIRTTESDADGDYLVTGLLAGTYSIKVLSCGTHIGTELEDVVVVANTETTDQNFTLATGGTISGTVSDTTGGIEGVIVSALSGTDPNDFASTLTDSNGDYSVGGFPTGTYTVIVQADSYVSDSETNVSVTSGEDSANHDFTLGTSGGSISGTVYESDETTAIEGALVSCYCQGKSMANTTTDSNGDYSLPLLQPGTYEVNAFAVGFQIETLTDVVVTGTQENSDNIFTLDVQ